MDHIDVPTKQREPWNKAKLVGQKAPLKLKEIWAIRIRYSSPRGIRDLALFNLSIDSKLRACDLVKLRVRDIAHGDRVSTRATVMQQKTQRQVQFEITEPTRDAVTNWISHARLRSESYLFPTRLHHSLHLSTRQYARIVDGWGPDNSLGPRGLRHALDAARQAVIDLQANKESARGPTAARSHENGEHSQIPGHRG